MQILPALVKQAITERASVLCSLISGRVFLMHPVNRRKDVSVDLHFPAGRHEGIDHLKEQAGIVSPLGSRRDIHAPALDA